MTPYRKKVTKAYDKWLRDTERITAEILARYHVLTVTDSRERKSRQYVPLSLLVDAIIKLEDATGKKGMMI